MITLEKQILAQLSTVMDPDLQRDIVTLGFVKNLTIKGGDVAFDIELTTPACPVKDQLREAARSKVAAIPGVDRVDIKMTARVQPRGGMSVGPVLRDVKNIIAVASGKGGVGKSTTAVNLALGLAASGAAVGIMDADIYGPSVAMMLNAGNRPFATPEGKILPIENFGLKIISMAMFTDDNAPLVWRAPMVTNMLMQFFRQVEWGALDYLVIDLPPGTGDIQLTLTQQCPLSGAIIVTTPQDVALLDARKGLRMFDQVKVPILGIVENMSYFVCDNCNKEHHIFSRGGGERMEAQFGVPLLAKIPLIPEMVPAGDRGRPLVAMEPQSRVGAIYRELAGKVASQLATWHHQGANVLLEFKFDWQEMAQVVPVPPTPLASTPEIGSPLPRRVERIGTDKLSITWNDEVVQHFAFPLLRESCACASCRDEWTGTRIFPEGGADPTIHPLSLQSVGRYAIHFNWSDGHGSGIYSYQLLRALGKKVLEKANGATGG